MALDDASHSCIAVAGRGTRFLTHPHSLLLALVQVAVVANTLSLFTLLQVVVGLLELAGLFGFFPKKT